MDNFWGNFNTASPIQDHSQDSPYSQKNSFNTMANSSPFIPDNI